MKETLTKSGKTKDWINNSLDTLYELGYTNANIDRNLNTITSENNGKKFILKFTEKDAQLVDIEIESDSEEDAVQYKEIISKTIDTQVVTTPIETNTLKSASQSIPIASTPTEKAPLKTAETALKKEMVIGSVIVAAILVLLIIAAMNSVNSGSNTKITESNVIIGTWHLDAEKSQLIDVTSKNNIVDGYLSFSEDYKISHSLNVDKIGWRSEIASTYSVNKDGTLNLGNIKEGEPYTYTLTPEELTIEYEYLNDKKGLTYFYKKTNKTPLEINPSASTTSSPPTTAETPTPTPAPTPKQTIYKPGTYKIGIDIPAGDYFVIGPGYIEVSSDSAGDSIIDNENVKTCSYVRVNDGEYLKVSRCRLVPEAETPPLEVSSYTDGTFRVGVDIPAGEYKITAKDSSGYFERNAAPLGASEDIIDNDNFQGSTYITIHDGEYLKLNNCTLTK